MKLFCSSLLLLLVLAATSCGSSQSDNEKDSGKEKTKSSDRQNSEKERSFVLDFALKASNNQIDSLISIYPGIENVDSIALNYVEDGIVINTSEDRKESEVIFGPEARIWIAQNEDGSFTVTDSKGLFVFPEELVAFAQEQGLIKEEDSDLKKTKALGSPEFKDAYALKLKREEINLRVSDFFKNNKFDSLKSTPEIKKFLKDELYTLASTKVVKGDPDSDLAVEQEEYQIYTYEKNGVKVIVYGGEINTGVDLVFTDNQQVEEFVKSLKDTGWKKDGPFYYFGDDIHYYYIEINGLNVNININAG